MKKILLKLVLLYKNTQGISDLLAIAVMYFLSPWLIQKVDHTAGSFLDGGYLQRPIIAAVYLLFAQFIVWRIIKFNARHIDKWIDAGKVFKDWCALTPKVRIILLLSSMAFVLIMFAVFIELIPV